LLFIHDIFGLDSGLNKQVCDQFADALSSQGFLVIAPDFFPDGNPWAGSNLSGRGSSAVFCFILRALCTCRLFGHIHQRKWHNDVDSIFNDTTTYLLSSQFNIQSIALFGVCWGSYTAFKACSEAVHRDKIVANVSVHPSVHSLCGFYKDDEEAVIQGVHCPQLVGATKDEPPRWYPGGSVETALKTKEFGAKNEFYFYNVKHGFYTRGDTKDKDTFNAMQDFHEKTVSFLKRHVL
jgi:dienelactone hydrolase